MPNNISYCLILTTKYQPTNVEESAPNHPGEPLHPLATREQKCPKLSWQASTTPPPFTGNSQYGNNIFQKGIPLLLMIKLGVVDGFSVKDQLNFLII